MSAREFESRWVKFDGKEVLVPQFSKWEEKCHCCGCHVTYFPIIDQYFCNHWECHFGYPMIVILLVIASFIFGIWSIVDLFEDKNLIIFVTIFSVFFLLWLISFLLAMCKSPGYLPWYWAVEKGTEYTFQEQMDGIITNENQYNFALQNARPERATLTKKGRRFVLRADHICPWIANWLGLKNYRHFIQFLFWNFSLFVCFFVLFVYQIYDAAKNGWKTRASTIGTFICALPDIPFFIFFLIILFRHLYYLCTNTTTLQELKAHNGDDESEEYYNPYNNGCRNNCAEVMGPHYCCCLWCCPFVCLPYLNSGIFWHQNDEDDTNVDYSKPVPRKKAVFVHEPKTIDQKIQEQVTNSPKKLKKVRKIRIIDFDQDDLLEDTIDPFDAVVEKPKSKAHRSKI
ncbi:DHHC zinc finger domain containing protein [Trichomonas vaginalis G3]|uniref:Palmitoyltransferase n=1 Tax=Trichomonas vaginalis (strain ATCC PRA-98 / G3) TaxID=412133 RepID=A2DT27_TRIV3|nr:cysteine S-palmitoyltransferase protein [Trichomonas vaginalis G3]EAY16434.1 DHHC zinc finger domain containing protein [Trichomonas vaginalis G3]KAI5505700.1 cysteine S-palmitoyltransferase protein [Trichomonas vaginalis G3]|eukprot:XP_001328657.1 DHHC zinc finger domain containing protein [Trichomonas vaginalis G3]